MHAFVIYSILAKLEMAFFSNGKFYEILYGHILPFEYNPAMFVFLSLTKDKR